MNVLHQLQRWRASRAELLGQLDQLRRENESLRSRVASLQLAKDQAERHAEDRKREKEALRAKLADQKKSADSVERTTEQLNTKIAELRAEIAALTKKRGR